jgi:hypothetical protein
MLVKVLPNAASEERTSYVFGQCMNNSTIHKRTYYIVPQRSTTYETRQIIHSHRDRYAAERKFMFPNINPTPPPGVLRAPRAGTMPLAIHQDIL